MPPITDSENYDPSQLSLSHQALYISILNVLDFSDNLFFRLMEERLGNRDAPWREMTPDNIALVQRACKDVQTEIFKPSCQNNTILLRCLMTRVRWKLQQLIDDIHTEGIIGEPRGLVDIELSLMREQASDIKLFSEHQKWTKSNVGFIYPSLLLIATMLRCWDFKCSFFRSCVFETS